MSSLRVTKFSFVLPSVLFILLVLRISPSYGGELMELYYHALTSDAQLRSDHAAYRSSKELVKIGRAVLFPKIDTLSTFSHEKNETFYQSANFAKSSNERKDSHGLSLSQKIIDVPAWYNFKRTSTLSDKGKLDYDVAQLYMIVRVVQSYLSTLKSESQLQLYLEEQAAYAEYLNLAKRRLASGVASIIDVHEAEAAYNLSEATTVSARNNLVISNAQVKVITGEVFNSRQKISDDLPVVLPMPRNSDEWVRISLENNPRLKSKALNTASLYFASRGALFEHLPKVSGHLGYRESNSKNSSRFQNSELDITGAIASLSVSIPIYAGGGTSAVSRRANEDFSQAAELESLMRRELATSVATVFSAVAFDAESIRTYKRAIHSNEKGLRATVAGYKIGARNFSDVLISQRLLFQAKREKLNSVYSYVFNTILLKEASGTLSVADVSYIDSWLVDK